MDLTELENKIKTDKEELQEIEILLEGDPSNQELITLQNDLVEIIKQSQELLTNKQRENENLNNNNSNNENNNNSNNNNENIKLESKQEETIVPLNYIENNTIKQKLNSQDSKLVVGSQCEAQYTVDNQ